MGSRFVLSRGTPRLLSGRALSARQGIDRHSHRVSSLGMVVEALTLLSELFERGAIRDGDQATFDANDASALPFA